MAELTEQQLERQDYVDYIVSDLCSKEMNDTGVAE